VIAKGPYLLLCSIALRSLWLSHHQTVDLSVNMERYYLLLFLKALRIILLSLLNLGIR